MTKVEPPKDDEDLREAILTLGVCVGPYDTPHRCSNLHCDHCGICDISEDLLALIKLQQEALLNSALDKMPDQDYEGGGTNPYKEKYATAYTNGRNAGVREARAVVNKLRLEL